MSRRPLTDTATRNQPTSLAGELVPRLDEHPRKGWSHVHGNAEPTGRDRAPAQQDGAPKEVQGGSDWPESLGSDESSSRARPGKHTRAEEDGRVRCAGCRALVVPAAVDAAGLCDSCTTQRVLFGVKPVKRRRFTATSRYPIRQGWGPFPAFSSVKAGGARRGSR